MKTKWLSITGCMLVGSMTLLATCGLTQKEGDDRPKTESAPVFYTSVPVPDSMTFVGETVPLHRFEVHESMERELLVNSYFHSQTIRFIKMAPRFFSIIDPILKENGIPADFRYLAVAESNLDPKIVSPAGAVGLWQFMKETAVEYGLEVNNEVDERYHIEKSTRAACRFLQSAHERYGNWTLVAAAYNSGRTFVVRQMTRQRTNNYFDLLLGEETERYLFRIMALKLILENPEKYGFKIDEAEKYPVWQTRKVAVSGAVPDFTDFAAGYGISYKTLKYYNPWLRDVQLVNKAGKTYLIDIPVETAAK